MSAKRTLNCGDRSLDLSRTVIMGVLNVTPDSFSDGGHFIDPGDAIRQAEEMCTHGAEIIDVGGESTRPGSDSVSTSQELGRVIPLIEALHGTVDAVISIDTTKPEVMREALAAGAGFINDVNALRAEETLQIVAQNNVPVCLMHMLGKPKTMQHNPTYGDVVTEIRDFLLDRAAACRDAGVSDRQIIFDPGFGFGKTVDHNLDLLRNLSTLSDKYPILVGLSRKSMIQKLLGLAVDARINASVALALIAVKNGANIVRAHDVKETCEAIRMYECVYPSH